MRILHTSDWHLGRSFHRVGMLEHQAGFVDHLLEVVGSERVDLVVVAGDVYDRALPHVDAVRLADETLARLAASRARVVISSGNHDSAQRLGFGARLIDAAGVHVRTDASGVGTPVLLDDEHGPVAVHAIPYLDPQGLSEPWRLAGRTHEAALTEAMRRVRADLAARPIRSVVLAHAFVAGGLPSDSERDISLGGVSVVSDSLFDGISYTALGHLHGRATLGETLRYSGSPLAYSFSEAAHTKGSWLVDLGADGVTSTTFVESPVPRRLSSISGELRSLLDDPTLAEVEGHWVQATLTDAVRPDHPMERLRARFPHTLVLTFAPAGEPLPSVIAEAPSGRSDHRVSLDFVEAMRGAPASAEESDLLLQACDACVEDPEADVLVSSGGERLMRLHHLSVTAFGPFVETAEVDFDALSGAGLFLLSGPTGAGKSSVLDAVCFALYGAVPGDRQHAGRLRSDQAPPDLAPEVTLDADLAGRRFRIVRSPAWDRPKKRGTGMTREQARVSVSEQMDDEWVPLTHRLDEAGDLLAGLLGMNLDQFCQVALLPQGHFQAFLRADSGQRHHLLARLFRTGRFERVEAWLRDHRLALRRGCDESAAVVAGLVSRLSEAAHLGVPDDLADVTGATTDELSAWAREVHDEATARRGTTATQAQAASTAHHVATTDAEAARALAAARARVVTAAETVEQLEVGSERHAAQVTRLERARRADGVHPLARLVDARLVTYEEIRQRSGASLAAAVDAGLDVDDLEGELERATDALASRTALLPAERRLAEQREAETAATVALADLTADDELATAEAEAVSVLVAGLTARVDQSDEAVRALPDADAVVTGLRSTVAAHDDIARLSADHETALADHAGARLLVADARERLLDLRERRIAGMAAELAGSLAVGADCPVCGSLDHPHPAQSHGAQPDADAERDAQRAVDDAQLAEHALHERVRDLSGALATARASAGATEPESAMAALAAAEADLAEARARAAAGGQLRERRAEATKRAAELASSTLERRLRSTALTTELEALRAQAADLEASLVEARGDHPGLRSAVEALTARKELIRAVRADATAVVASRKSHADASSELEAAAVEAGFASPTEARGAQLSPEALTALDELVQEHRARLAAARQVLDEPDAWELLTTPEPDVTAADAAARTAAEERERCHAAAQVAASTAERVRRLTGELESALGAWAPVREQLALATRVASFAEGKAPDNRLQMRLSAYVLAYRLTQVVAAANARLAQMSDRRYSLEHVGQRGAGERRGGLSLVVCDDWSGESRDPATLSGGETFVVSLALALGLADVVAHESGGADLQTLFVDEGFGALDAETLDDVLDILDALRENGRAVGVVSHVAEMRDRIPTQLVVGKSRAGSTLRVVS